MREILLRVLLMAVIPAAAAFAGEPLAAADNAFGFRLIRELTKEQPGINVCISPYSTATLLQMVGAGAASTTLSEMQHVLHTMGVSSAGVNAGSRVIAKSLTTNGHVELITANALWYRPGIPVKPKFLSDSQMLYDATLAPLNFSDPAAMDIMNAWASDRTQGKIPRIAHGKIDAANTQFFMANAIYFKGKWSSPFEARYTQIRTFHLRGGAEKRIPMMVRSKQWEYLEGGGYQAVRVPYEGDTLAMYLILPDAHNTPETILGILSGGRWQEVMNSGFDSHLVNLVVPKFKIEYSVELVPALKALGMKAAFYPNADFSGIAPGVFISVIRHESYIEINEEGTEAAAVSALGHTLGAPPEIVDMIIDRPFLLLVADRQTSAIIFLGAVFDPPTNAWIERLH